MKRDTSDGLRASIVLHRAGWYLDIPHGPISGYTAGGIARRDGT